MPIIESLVDSARRAAPVLAALCAVALPAVACAQQQPAAPPGASGSQPPPAVANLPAAPPPPSAAPERPAGGAHPTRHGFRWPAIGPEIGLYAPASAKTRDRFGSDWFSIGLGIGSIDPARRNGAVGLDIDLIGTSSSGRHAYFAPIGLAYRQALGGGVVARPYAGASADLVLADVRSPADGAHSGLNSTGGASVFIGATFERVGYVEARYIWVGQVQGFDLSGLELTAGLRF